MTVFRLDGTIRLGMGGRAAKPSAGKGRPAMFRLVSADIAPPQDSGPTGHPRRRAVASAIGVGAATVALLAAANAIAQRPINSSRMAQEHQACAVVMGLHHPGNLYDTCIRSLNKTLTELDRARLTSTNRSACTQKGLQPGTSAFATCVVNAEQSPADRDGYVATAPVH
jgi:hypothetical protein